MDILFAGVGIGLLLAALLGRTVKLAGNEIPGPETPRARAATGLLGLVFLVAALFLAGVIELPDRNGGPSSSPASTNSAASGSAAPGSAAPSAETASPSTSIPAATPEPYLNGSHFFITLDPLNPRQSVVADHTLLAQALNFTTDRDVPGSVTLRRNGAPVHTFDFAEFFALGETEQSVDVWPLIVLGGQVLELDTNACPDPCEGPRVLVQGWEYDGPFVAATELSRASFHHELSIHDGPVVADPGSAIVLGTVEIHRPQQDRGRLLLVVGDNSQEFNLTNPETIGSELDPFTWRADLDPPQVVKAGQEFHVEWRCETACADVTIALDGFEYRAL